MLNKEPYWKLPKKESAYRKSKEEKVKKWQKEGVLEEESIDMWRGREKRSAQLSAIAKGE